MQLKKGDYVRCKSKEDMVNVRCELQDAGIDTKFCYERNGVKGFWLEIIKGANDEESRR